MATAWRPRLTARALRPVLAGLEALGHPGTDFLARAGINPQTLGDPDARLPAGATGRLWQLAVDVTGDALLGMHVALAAPITSFEMHAYAMLSSPTLGDAYRRASRYHRLINEGSKLTFRQGTVNVLEHSLLDGRPVPRQPAEFLVTTWLRLGRLVTGSPWIPARVHFAHERPADTTEYEAVFGAPVQFASDRTALYVPAAALDLKNSRSDPTLVSLIDRYADSLLETRVSIISESARVRAWLVEVHEGGVPSAAKAAKALTVSPRTLHRRLKQEGTTFRRLLDDFRQRKARTLLGEHRHSIAEIAFLLGYSELSAFYRAFKRWTGRSPAELRKEIVNR
jgi:AraC-like DNA-binding protein